MDVDRLHPWLEIVYIIGRASPLRLACTLARAPLRGSTIADRVLSEVEGRRRAPFAWLTRRVRSRRGYSDPTAHAIIAMDRPPIGRCATIDPMTSVSLADVRASLLQAPRIIEGLVASAPAGALTWREGEGAWNGVEVLCHLADGEITNWIPRVNRILGGGGRFTPFDREGGFTRYAGWTADQLVGEFGQLRRANVETIDRLDLTPIHLTMRGEHPEFGPVTLEQLLACWATHDFAHMAQISRILTRAFGEHVGPWRRYFSLLQDRVRS